jgi:hypothetical protein
MGILSVRRAHFDKEPSENPCAKISNADRFDDD